MEAAYSLEAARPQSAFLSVSLQAFLAFIVFILRLFLPLFFILLLPCFDNGFAFIAFIAFIAFFFVEAAIMLVRFSCSKIICRCWNTISPDPESSRRSPGCQPCRNVQKAYSQYP